VQVKIMVADDGGGKHLPLRHKFGSKLLTAAIVCLPLTKMVE
jgi:hypothetical protein